jgi:hypothetical protein
MIASKHFFSLVGAKIDKFVLDPETPRYAMVADGRVYRWEFIPECEETCRLYKIIGTPQALEGHTITLAESTILDPPDAWRSDVASESCTFEAYYLEAGGHRLELIFLGESNGWYGETMDFFEDLL